MQSQLTEATDPAHSSLREKMIETIFLADLSRVLWRRGRRDCEVLRSEVDRGGYDLVVACAGVMRHIQLKSRHLAGKNTTVSVSTLLAAKPSGCVVWIDYDPLTMAIGPFRWFGGRPGEPLPDLGTRITRHTRGEKKERSAHRDLARSGFVVLPTMEDVATALFGDETTSDPALRDEDGSNGAIDDHGSGAVEEPFTGDRLAELAAFAPRFAAAAEGGENGTATSDGTWVFENADGSIPLPHCRSGKLPSEFYEMTYRCGWIDPDFEWMEPDGAEVVYRLRTEPHALDMADERDLSHLLTALVRSERFAEGTLDEALRSSLLARITDRAVVLVGARSDRVQLRRSGGTRSNRSLRSLSV